MYICDSLFLGLFTRRILRLFSDVKREFVVVFVLVFANLISQATIFKHKLLAV